MKASHYDPLERRVVSGVLAASVALALTACGGGSSSTAPAGRTAVTAASGVVIDGYLQGAIVCVDSDNDGTCKVAATGNDEANRTTTAADGTYTLPSAVAEGAYILVETTGDTIDADVAGKKFSDYGVAEGAVDANGTALSGGRPQFKLMAPAQTVDGQEKFIVTPLTTVVANAMQEDPSLSTPALAAASIVGSMGVDAAKFNLFADYKAAGTQALDADTKTKLGEMANIVADSMGRTQQVLNGVVPTGQEADLRRKLFKESISQTWSLMASNVKPDGGLVMNKADFQGALEKTVEGERQAIVTRAVFAKDLPAGVVVPSGPEAMLENNSRNLYIGTCRDKTAFLARALDDAKLSKYSGLSPESLFCDTDQFATVATLRIGANDPWPVPMTGIRVAGAWKHAPGNGEGFFGLTGQNMILTELGWENYDYAGAGGGQLTCTSGGFRPRTAGGAANCTKLVQTTIPQSSAADANCITFSYSKTGSGDVYGEKYCFTPIPLKDKKVGALDPSCLGKTTSACTGGSTFADGAYGFDVRTAFAFDAYILHPARGDGPDEGATANTTIADMIRQIATSGKAVDICDAKTTAYFSYWFTFDTVINKMKLVGIDPPRKSSDGKLGCASDAAKTTGSSENRGFDDSTKITAGAGVKYCELGFHSETGGQQRDTYAQFCGTNKDGPLKRLTLTQEEAPYEIVDVSIAGGPTVKVFRTGAFASTKAITKAITEALSDSSTGKSPQPTGFIATVVDRQVRFGEYWKKNATVKELSFMSGNEKVFNAKAGETILGGASVFNGSTVIQAVQ